MSNLDLIRSVRHALAGLRDAEGPSAVDDIARSLALELYRHLGAQLQLELETTPAPPVVRR